MFSYFITAIQKEKNEIVWAKQVSYLQSIQNLYQNVRTMGPCYISGDKIIRLKDGTQDSVKRILQEGFIDPTENHKHLPHTNCHSSDSSPTSLIKEENKPNGKN